MFTLSESKCTMNTGRVVVQSDGKDADFLATILYTYVQNQVTLTMRVLDQQWDDAFNAILNSAQSDIVALVEAQSDGDNPQTLLHEYTINQHTDHLMYKSGSKEFMDAVIDVFIKHGLIPDLLKSYLAKVAAQGYVDRYSSDVPGALNYAFMGRTSRLCSIPEDGVLDFAAHAP